MEEHHVYQYFLQDAKRLVVTLDKNFIAETFVGQHTVHPTSYTVAAASGLLRDFTIIESKIRLDLSETFLIFCYRYIQPNYPRGFSFIIKIWEGVEYYLSSLY